MQPQLISLESRCFAAPGARRYGMPWPLFAVSGIPPGTIAGVRGVRLVRVSARARARGRRAPQKRSENIQKSFRLKDCIRASRCFKLEAIRRVFAGPPTRTVRRRPFLIIYRDKNSKGFITSMRTPPRIAPLPYFPSKYRGKPQNSFFFSDSASSIPPWGRCGNVGFLHFSGPPRTE